jgi:hypothetical protein
VAQVLRKEHDRHAALSELALDLVARDEPAVEAGGQSRHRRTNLAESASKFNYSAR